MTFTPSPFVVSAMTVFGSLGEAHNLERLYEVGSFIPYWWIGEGILMLDISKGHSKSAKADQYPQKRKGLYKGDILHSASKKKAPFCNQSTLVFRLHIGPEPHAFKEINIKLFKDEKGGFQMTGVTTEEMARKAIERLIDLNDGKGVWSKRPSIQRFQICMINSNYSIGKTIRRDRLYAILVHTYGLRCSFEPTIYQGVNTKFFWNKTTQGVPNLPPGICTCPEQCIGKGDGYSVGNCKQITISPFRTGSIIITGAQHLEQIEDAYKFLNSVFREYEADLLRPIQPTQEPKHKHKDKGDTQPTTTTTTTATPTTTIIRHKMRTCPKNTFVGTKQTNLTMNLCGQ